MAHNRSRAWRRSQARKKDGRESKSQTTTNRDKLCRKLMWRRSDKLFLRCKEGHLALYEYCSQHEQITKPHG